MGQGQGLSVIPVHEAGAYLLLLTFMPLGNKRVTS